MVTPPSTKKAVTLTPKGDLRGWIKSVTLSPGLPNKSDFLIATVDWEPTGRPGIAVTTHWFVNGVETAMGDTRQISLAKLNSGDRVYVVSDLIADDGRVLASKRSLSVVIQNRPPTLDSGLEDLMRSGDELIGRIRFSDPDGDPVVVKLLEGPDGLSVGPHGTVHWALRKVRAGNHKLIVELEDERGLGYRATISFFLEEGA